MTDLRLPSGAGWIPLSLGLVALLHFLSSAQGVWSIEPIELASDSLSTHAVNVSISELLDRPSGAPDAVSRVLRELCVTPAF